MKYMRDDFAIVQHEIIHQGMFRFSRYQLKYKLFNGDWSKTITRELFERLSAAAILPYDPKLDRVILIEQFRLGSMNDPQSPWLIEIPAGILDKETDPELVAKREAREEADCNILSLEPICEYYVSPGGSNEYLHMYCGIIDSTLVSGIHGIPEESEDIRVINISTDEALKKLHRGEIKTSPAILGLFWLQIHRKRLQDSYKNI